MSSRKNHPSSEMDEKSDSDNELTHLNEVRTASQYEGDDGSMAYYSDVIAEGGD